MDNEVVNILLRMEDKLDNIEEKLVSRISNVELDVAVCKTQCKKKVEITKAKLTFYGTVIGGFVGIIVLVIQKFFK